MNVRKIWWYVSTQFQKMMFGHLGHHSYIGPTKLIQNKKSLFIGDKVRIQPGLRADTVCDDAKICIEDNCSIAQNFHVVSYSRNLTIGKNTTISANVFVSNVDHDYTEIDKHIMEQDMLYKETVIGENCFIGYGAVILPGTRLGKQCVVGANSVVRGAFPDYCVIAGAPAKIVKKYNVETKKWEKL